MTEVLKAKDFFDQGVVPMCVFRMSSFHRSREVHTHDFYELMIVVKGVARHYLEGVEMEVIGTGDAYVIHPGRYHSYDSLEGQPIELVNVLFQLDRMKMDFRDLEGLPGFQTLFGKNDWDGNFPHVRLDAKDLAHALSVIADIELEMEELAPGYEFLVETKLRELIVFLSRKHSHVLEPKGAHFLKLGELVVYMEQNLKEDLRFEQLAELAYMSPTSLRRAFQHSFTCSPMGYLQKLRIQQAMLLLADPDLSVTEIAHSVGYNDSSYFARVFKQEVGEPPKAYRLRH
jgi:AraC-like DNA-binding protein